MIKRFLFTAAVSVAMSCAAYAQTNYEDIYKSEAYQKTIKDGFAANKEYFPEISARAAKNEITKMEREGYTFDKDYVREIDANLGNKDKIKELYFYAVNNAVPPRGSIASTKEETEAEIIKAEKDFYDKYGMSMEDMKKMLDEQEKAPKRPVPESSDN